jgi:hypothetical protein
MSQLLLSSPVPKTSTPRQFNAQNLRVPSSMDTTDRKRAIEDGYAFDGMSEVALTDDTEDNDRREDNNSSGPLFCTSSAFVWLPSFSAPLCPPNPIARSFDARRSDPPSGTTRHRSFDGDKPNSGVDPQYHGAALSSPSSLPPSPHLPYYTDTTSMSPPHSSPPSPLSSLTRESSFPIPSTFSSHDTRPHVISTIARSPSGQTSAETLRNLFADEPVNPTSFFFFLLSFLLHANNTVSFYFFFYLSHTHARKAYTRTQSIHTHTKHTHTEHTHTEHTHVTIMCCARCEEFLCLLNGWNLQCGIVSGGFGFAAMVS